MLTGGRNAHFNKGILTIVLVMFLTCQGFVLQHPIPFHITINGIYYVKLYNKVPLVTIVIARIWHVSSPAQCSTPNSIMCMACCRFRARKCQELFLRSAIIKSNFQCSGKTGSLGVPNPYLQKPSTGLPQHHYANCILTYDKCVPASVVITINMKHMQGC